MRKRSTAPPARTDRSQRPKGMPLSQRTQMAPPRKCSAVCQTVKDSHQALVLPATNDSIQRARSLPITPSPSTSLSRDSSTDLPHWSDGTDRPTYWTLSPTAPQYARTPPGST